jgi:hypothetical protein
MNRSQRNKFLILSLTFVLAFSITTPVAAEGLITGDTIPAGMIYDHDAILIGQNVVIDGTVNGNVFILGNQVTVNGKVDGSLILIGQNAGIGGTVTGDVYAVAMTLDLAPLAVIQRDLYVATVSMTSGSDSLIGRDLFAIGLDSGLNGQVERDLHTVIGPIQLYNGLMTLLGYDNLTIKLHFETPIRSTSPSGSLISPGRPANQHFAKLRRPVADPVNAFDWGKWVLNLLRNWAVLFIFSLLALWWGRKSIVLSGEMLKAHPWRAFGTGLLVLIISIASIGAALLLTVIIFAIGLGLNSLGVWPVTIALWAGTYALLAAALVALWAFIVYGTKIICFYFIGTWVFGKLFSKKAIWIEILALLAASVIYSLLRSIPYVGWILDILVTALGAGSAWLAYRGAMKKPQTAVVQVEPGVAVLPAETMPALVAVKSVSQEPKLVSIKAETVPVEQPPKMKMSRRKR